MPEKPIVQALLAELGLNIHSISVIIIASMSSAMLYLNKVKKGVPFNLFFFFVNIFTAIIIAFACDLLIQWYDPSFDGNVEKAIMVFIGITANRFLEVIETQGSEWISRKAKEILKDPK